MNPIIRRRLGISTIVATSLMLGAIAILGTTMVMWANSNLTSRETVLATASSTRVNTFNEFLSIENVWLCNGGGTTEPCHPLTSPGCSVWPALNTTITNSGSIGLNVTQITLATTVNNQITTNVYPIKNVALTPGQYYMWAQYYCNYQHKVPVTISVTTARGSIFTTQVTLP